MEKITFITSLFTFYIKGELFNEQNFIKTRIPNVILSFIPLGSRNETIPINQIASVQTNFQLYFKGFFIGIVMAIIGLCCLGTSVLLGLILIALGVLNIINAFETILIINMTSGKEFFVSFLVFEKSKAVLAEQSINYMISNRLDDTNVRQQTDRNIQDRHQQTDRTLQNSNQQADRLIDAINRK